MEEKGTKMPSFFFLSRAFDTKKEKKEKKEKKVRFGATIMHFCHFTDFEMVHSLMYSRRRTKRVRR